MRLNGWQRIGVVVSVCWFVVGGLWINSAVIDDLGRPAVAEHRRCLDAHSIQPDGTIPADTDWGPCTKRFMAAFPSAVADHWLYAVPYTLIPFQLFGFSFRAWSPLGAGSRPGLLEAITRSIRTRISAVRMNPEPVTREGK